jgi:YbbR domain-containing protein
MNLIISIVAAIAIWVYVVTFINPVIDKTIRDVPVKMINMEALTQNGLTVSPDQVFAVDVVVKGSRADLNELSASDLTATADMTGFPLGRNTVDVEVSAPDKIEVVETHPDKIEVVVEDLISVTKPVVLEYSGEFESGIEPGFITLSPREISVSGTKKLVDSIDTVRAKIESDALTDEEKTITSKVEAYTKSGESVYGVTYSQNEIDVTAQLCHTKEVPLKLNVTGAPAAGLSITNTDVPKSVTIRGNEKAVSEITEVAGRDINIEGIKETTMYTPDLDLPKDVELAEASLNSKVTVEIGGIEAKNVLLTPDMIAIIGLPKDYTAHITTGELPVTIYGTRNDIKSMTSTDISAYIDLAKITLDEGVIEAKVLFEKDKRLTKIECVPPEVKVNITRTNTNSAGVTALQTAAH